jgi:polysaccharide chain length determinant protein (PEP-CTERM system associated)
MQNQLVKIYGYLRSMWRYRWSALFIAWMVSLAGWFVVLALPDQYEANAVIYIDTDSVMKPLLEGLAVDTDTVDELKVMSRILMSRENLLSVMRETDMDLRVDTPKDREQMMVKLAREIGLQGSGENSNIYEISYGSTSAEIAYKVVSHLLGKLIEGTLNSGRTDTAMAQEFLDTQIAEYERRLVLAEGRLAKFKKENLGLMPDERGGYYSDLQRRLIEIEHTRMAMSLAARRLSELHKQLQGEGPLLGGGEQGERSLTKLGQYQGQLDELLSLYTEQHPDVEVMREKIADINAKPAGNTGAAVTGTGQFTEFNPVYQELKIEISKASVEVETLKIQLFDQEKRLEELKLSIDAIPEVEAQLSKLNRDYEVTRERYLNLVERRESARMAQAVGQTSSDFTFQVIDPPVVPVLPSGPNRLLLLAGVLFAALGAGLGWGLLRFQLKPVFIDSSQYRSVSRLPVLGAVSLYVTPQHKKRRHLQLVSFLAVTVLLVALFGGVLWYRDIGVAVAKAAISGIGFHI